MTPEENIELSAEMLRDILTEEELAAWKERTLRELKSSPEAMKAMEWIPAPNLVTCTTIGQANAAIRRASGLPSVEQERGRNANSKRKDRGPHMDTLKDFAWQLYEQGPMVGQWESDSHAARSIIAKVNAKAPQLGRGNVREGTIRNWIREQRKLHATGRMQE